MRSPRNDALSGGARLAPMWRTLGLLQRLNVRLVLALATVVIVALLVSGIALSQIVPGYFREQAVRKANAAVVSTGILVQTVAENYDLTNRSVLRTAELRNTVLLQNIAQRAANSLAQGTVDIWYKDGPRAAHATPGPATTDALRTDGFAVDPEVPAQEVAGVIPDGFGGRIELVFTVSDVFTNREATLARVNGTLVGAGFAALAVAILVGAFVARRLTGPLLRLRRVSGRLAQGELDERAPRFDLLEVDELGQQFNVMADRLSDTLRMLEADRDRLREFVADVSHELRTPIAALRTFTDLQRDGKMEDGQRREFLDRSTEQINRLEWMSANLLDLSRMDSGIFPLDMRPGDLRDPVRNVVEAMAEQAEQRGVALSVELPSEPIMLRFDRERIVQLLNNLVGNALKFTPRGGEVLVEARDGDDAAVIEVRDSGPGIPEGELPHIFDRFFRGTNVGDARASGSGLGLAITRSLAELHGGRIEVQSAVGQGSVFSVYLPRSTNEGQ